MTPKEARLILRDGGFRSLLEASHPDAAPSDDSVEYLRDEIYPALKSLDKLIRKTAKRRTKCRAKSYSPTKRKP